MVRIPVGSESFIDVNLNYLMSFSCLLLLHNPLAQVWACPLPPLPLVDVFVIFVLLQPVLHNDKLIQASR